MNKTEEKYAWHLEVQKRKGEILAWHFEQVKFKLTSTIPGRRGIHYNPDFFIVLPDGSMRIDEVKGAFVREDAELKFIMAAELFPWFHWRMMQFTQDWSFKVLRDLPRRNLIGSELFQAHHETVEPAQERISGPGGGELRRKDRQRSDHKDPSQTGGGRPDRGDD